jgi:hypothetical protein
MTTCLDGKPRTRRGSWISAYGILGISGSCHDAVVRSERAGHVLRLPSRWVVWGTLILILAGGLVALFIVRVTGASDGSALARRPVVVRHLDRSLVSVGGYPRTYVDPAEADAQADLPAAAAFKGWLRLADRGYYDNARHSSKPIEVYLVRRSQPSRLQLKSWPPGHLEWMFWLTSVPCQQAGFQPGPPPPVDRDGCDEYLFLDAHSGSTSAGFGTSAGMALFVPA